MVTGHNKKPVPLDLSVGARICQPNNLAYYEVIGEATDPKSKKRLLIVVWVKESAKFISDGDIISEEYFRTYDPPWKNVK